MLSKPKDILKELYPKFPEWSLDFGRFPGLPYPDISILLSSALSVIMEL
jgi:hypothetical protein